MKHLNIGLFVYFILVLLIPSNISARSGSEIMSDSEYLVSKVIKAYGGEKVIDMTRAVYAKGRINADVKNDEGTYIRHWMRDRKLRVEVDYTRSREIRILDGLRGWRGTDREPMQEVTGHRLSSMIYQYKRLDIVYGLLKNKYKIKHTGKRTAGNKEFAVMELRDDEGPLIEVFIDLDNYLIIYIAGHFKINDKVAILSVVLNDFRLVNGMPMPYRISNFSGEVRIGENIIEEYRVNPSMDPDLFRPNTTHLL